LKIIKPRTNTKCSLGKTPCFRVAHGETFRIEIEDAFTGLIAKRLFLAI